MAITVEEYLNATKIIDQYNAEQKAIAETRRIARNEEQMKREAACGEHYFIERGKWQSGAECMHCGKQI